MSQVSIAKAGKDLHAAVSGLIDGLGRFVSHGDRVLLKPNLVNPEPPGSGLITSPELIEAVARYCLDRGAAVIIGEGPGHYNHKADLRDCFTTTGVSEVAERLGIAWVLFDDHGYRTFRDVSDCTPPIFHVTDYIFNCDKLINLPALKTHYLTTVTLAMKNLKGCLKWEDKPRFHYPDIHRAVVELNKIVRPALNIIDATNWEGSKLLLAGADIVAVDAVGSALMGIDPAQVRMITLGAKAGLGEADLTRIEITGGELKRLKLKVKLPREEIEQAFPRLEIIGAEKSCSGCLIPLIAALKRLRADGVKMNRPLAVCLGKHPQPPYDSPYLLLGDCALDEAAESRPAKVGGCPPDKGAIIESLRQLTI